MKTIRKRYVDSTEVYGPENGRTAAKVKYLEGENLQNESNFHNSFSIRGYKTRVTDQIQ